MKKIVFILTLIAIASLAYSGTWSTSVWSGEDRREKSNIQLDGNLRLTKIVGRETFTTTAETDTVFCPNGIWGDTPIAFALPADTSDLDSGRIWVEAANELYVVFKRAQLLPSGQPYNYAIFGK